jgi:hypothetical protein
MFHGLVTYHQIRLFVIVFGKYETRSGRGIEGKVSTAKDLLSSDENQQQLSTWPEAGLHRGKRMRRMQSSGGSRDLCCDVCIRQQISCMMVSCRRWRGSHMATSSKKESSWLDLPNAGVLETPPSSPGLNRIEMLLLSSQDSSTRRIRRTENYLTKSDPQSTRSSCQGSTEAHHNQITQERPGKELGNPCLAVIAVEGYQTEY